MTFDPASLESELTNMAAFRLVCVVAREAFPRPRTKFVEAFIGDFRRRMTLTFTEAVVGRPELSTPENAKVFHKVLDSVCATLREQLGE